METDKSNPGNIDPGPSPNFINNTVEAETGERNPDPNPPGNLSQASPPPVEATSGAQGLKDPYLNAAKANIPPQLSMVWQVHTSPHDELAHALNTLDSLT